MCCYSLVCVYMCCLFLFVFFFKQKTAYEMRISDWSSDVCSSDLPIALTQCSTSGPSACDRENLCVSRRGINRINTAIRGALEEIGRASCRKECVSTCRSRWSPYH